MEGTTHHQLAQGAVMLTTFACQQRFIDPESCFSRSRTGLKYDRTAGRRPAIRIPLDRGLSVAPTIRPTQVGIREAGASNPVPRLLRVGPKAGEDCS